MLVVAKGGTKPLTAGSRVKIRPCPPSRVSAPAGVGPVFLVDGRGRRYPDETGRRFPDEIGRRFPDEIGRRFPDETGRRFPDVGERHFQVALILGGRRVLLCRVAVELHYQVDKSPSKHFSNA